MLKQYLYLYEDGNKPFKRKIKGGVVGDDPTGVGENKDDEDIPPPLPQPDVTQTTGLNITLPLPVTQTIRPPLRITFSTQTIGPPIIAQSGQLEQSIVSSTPQTTIQAVQTTPLQAVQTAPLQAVQTTPPVITEDEEYKRITDEFNQLRYDPRHLDYKEYQDKIYDDYLKNIDKIREKYHPPPPPPRPEPKRKLKQFPVVQAPPLQDTEKLELERLDEIYKPFINNTYFKNSDPDDIFDIGGHTVKYTGDIQLKLLDEYNYLKNEIHKKYNPPPPPKISIPSYITDIQQSVLRDTINEIWNSIKYKTGELIEDLTTGIDNTGKTINKFGEQIGSYFNRPEITDNLSLEDKFKKFNEDQKEILYNKLYDIGYKKNHDEILKMIIDLDEFESNPQYQHNLKVLRGEIKGPLIRMDRYMEENLKKLDVFLQQIY